LEAPQNSVQRVLFDDKFDAKRTVMKNEITAVALTGLHVPDFEALVLRIKS
jgi:hypothetical protein